MPQKSDVIQYFEEKYSKKSIDLIRPILEKLDLSKVKPSTEESYVYEGDEITSFVDEEIQGDSIVCDECGWTWKIKDGGSDLYMCHKCGHDNTPQQPSSNDFFEPLQNQDIDLNISSDSNRVDYYKDHIKNVVPSDFKVDKHQDKIIVSLKRLYMKTLMDIG